MTAIMPSLFSDIQRVDIGPARYSESRFSYLDRSARPAFERIRHLLDRWRADFPATEQAQLGNRIRSGDDHQFIAAVFELYVHQILLRTNHRVEIHREGTTAKQPDFSATTSDGASVVLEAIVATETTDAQKGAEKRKSQLYDVIDRLECPDFFLSMEIEGEPNSPIPGDRWLRELKSWVSSLDYDAIALLGRQQAFNPLPTLLLEHDGLVVTFSPIAKGKETRGQTSGRPIGVRLFGVEYPQSWKAIQRAVHKKASRYGKQDCPYLIAINGAGYNCDFEEFEQAMYGPDGLWSVKRQPTHTRVSAILAVVQLVATTIGCAEARLLHNPFAANPYSGPLCQLPQAHRIEEDVRRTKGIAVSELLGLTKGWPQFDSDE
jgi:hypothetical protein